MIALDPDAIGFSIGRVVLGQSAQRLELRVLPRRDDENVGRGHDECCAKAMRTPLLLDGRNALPRDALTAAGLRYFAVGR